MSFSPSGRVVDLADLVRPVDDGHLRGVRVVGAVGVGQVLEVVPPPGVEQVGVLRPGVGLRVVAVADGAVLAAAAGLAGHAAAHQDLVHGVAVLAEEDAGREPIYVYD